MAQAAGVDAIAPPPVCLDTVVDYVRDRNAAAACYPRERLHHRLFRMPKLDLAVWFGSPELADLCASRLMPRAVDETAETRAEVMVLDATLPGWSVPATWREGALFRSRDFDQRLAAGRMRAFYHDAPSWQIFDPENATGVFSLPDPMGIPPWETGSPMRLFLHWAHACNGRRLTHAAAVGIDGAGALLAGASGSGKSGTALACLLHGLRCAGDDYVVVEAGEDVTAHAAFQIFKQDAEGLQRAGLDATNQAWGVTNWHGKYEFDAMKLSPSGFARRMPVRAILLPQIAHLPRTRIEPVERSAAALALAPSAVFQLPGDTDEGFRFFSGLARRLPAYRVLLSENPAEIAEAIGLHLTKEFGNAG